MDPRCRHIRQVDKHKNNPLFMAMQKVLKQKSLKAKQGTDTKVNLTWVNDRRKAQRSFLREVINSNNSRKRTRTKI